MEYGHVNNAYERDVACQCSEKGTKNGIITYIINMLFFAACHTIEPLHDYLNTTVLKIQINYTHAHTLQTIYSHIYL